MCDFLLVINTNLHPISHRFQVIAGYWSNLRFRQEAHLFLHTSSGEPLNLGPNVIWPQETRIIALSFGAKCISMS